MHRRHFLQSAAALPAAALLEKRGQPPFFANKGDNRLIWSPPVVKPKRLAPGDTVALVGPASVTWENVDLQIATESLEALGLKVKPGPHLMSRRGYFAGTDKERANDVNAAFADPSIAAVHAIRGGWGSSRILPYLDFDTIRRNPKILIGYSDITALLLSIYAKTGLVTFHGPIGMGRWDAFSLDYYKRVLFGAEAVTYENKRDLTPDQNVLVQTDFRTETITPGKARGRLLGGNLTVLTTIMGSPYLPDWDGSIFFCEDVHEDLYRIDRMLTQLGLAGVLGKIKGFVFGACAECGPGEGYASLTLDDILNDHITPLGIPAYQGAMIGHEQPQWTLPEGIEVEMDATAATIRLLEPAVA